MIVCACKRTSDHEIQSTIERGARTTDDVAKACGAGTGCGSCRKFICDMLKTNGQHDEACECNSFAAADVAA